MCPIYRQDTQIIVKKQRWIGQVSAELVAPVKLMPSHRINRRSSDRPTAVRRCIGPCKGKPSEENPVRLVKPTLGIRGIAAFTRLLSREHVKLRGARSSAPITPVGIGASRWFNNVSRRRWSSTAMWHVQCDQLNRYPSISLTDDSPVSSRTVSDFQRLLLRLRVTGLTDAPTDLTDALRRNWTTATNG